MRYTGLISALAALTAVSAQVALPSSIFGLSFSQPCQQAVIGVLTNSSFGQCIAAADLLPIFTMANSSAIPFLDKFMSDVCYSQPCTNDSLNAAASAIATGCAADIQMDGLGNQTVQQIFALYPLVREVLCTKTSQPYTNASYGGILGQPPIPITGSTYNSTGGYFCVTSFLTQLSAYFQANLSYATIAGIGSNPAAQQAIAAIQPNILCNGCLFGAVDLIALYVPAVLQIPAATIFGALGISAASQIPAGTTLQQAMDGTCSYVPLMTNTNGTLPANVSVSIVNSTFPFPVTNGPGS